MAEPDTNALWSTTIRRFTKKMIGDRVLMSSGLNFPDVECFRRGMNLFKVKLNESNKLNESYLHKLVALGAYILHRELRTGVSNNPGILR